MFSSSRPSAFTGIYQGAELKSAVSQTKSNLDKPHMSHTMLEIERMLEAAFVQRIVVGVMIDEPSAGKHYGGDVAAPVFSETVQQTLRILGVQPDMNVKPQIVTETVEESF